LQGVEAKVDGLLPLQMLLPALKHLLLEFCQH
jgi:hypothetical protein